MGCQQIHWGATFCPSQASDSVPRPVSLAMSHSLSVLCLLLLATSAFANDVVAGGVETVAKPGKTNVATATQDGETAPATPVVTPPTRTGTPRSALPRWHSMLPGMIR